MHFAQQKVGLAVVRSNLDGGLQMRFGIFRLAQLEQSLADLTMRAGKLRINRKRPLPMFDCCFIRLVLKLVPPQLILDVGPIRLNFDALAPTLGHFFPIAVAAIYKPHDSQCFKILGEFFQ